MKPVKNVTSATLYAANAASGVPSTGQLIGDRYRLDRPLERGAMGSVWRAEQVRLRAPVAVKFLDPSLIGDREMHDRFMQEARSAAAVRSAHVVQVFDYGSEGGVPYIAMELLDGENLDSRLGSRGTLTPAELDRLFAELARGISQAHAIGVIHRDLKPGNIFLAREGEHEVTKIVDFGIAKVKASALRLTQGVGTQLGTLLGTPQYMSPEQVRGSGSIDHRTDLWALAIIACECLTGRCPFSGSTIGDLTVQICTEKPPAPSTLGPVPAGFDQWFFRATHKKPNKRFQTVEEMAERLHAVLGPALATAPGARGGRLITLPSRSEVRLAYSAVVTWKGYVMTQLGQRWIELQKLWQELVVYLKARFTNARERLAALSESERLAFMRPLMERHGIMASVALLCCGILMLGLTSRGNEPSSSHIPNPGRVLQAAPVSEAMAAEPVAAPEADAPEARPGSVAAEAAPSVASNGGDVAAPNVEVTASNVPAAAADDALPPDAPALAVAPRSDLAHSSTRQNRPSTKEPTVAAVPPAAVTTPAGDRPITKAMAQAASKILNADELIASPRKPAPRAQPRKAPRARAHAKPSSSSSHPFDDRL